MKKTSLASLMVAFALFSSSCGRPDPGTQTIWTTDRFATGVYNHLCQAPISERFFSYEDTNFANFVSISGGHSCYNDLCREEDAIVLYFSSSNTEPSEALSQTQIFYSLGNPFMDIDDQVRSEPAYIEALSLCPDIEPTFVSPMHDDTIYGVTGQDVCTLTTMEQKCFALDDVVQSKPDFASSTEFP